MKAKFILDFGVKVISLKDWTGEQFISFKIKIIECHRRYKYIKKCYVLEHR